MSTEAEIKTLQKIIKLAQKCPKLINSENDKYHVGIDKNYITNRALRSIVFDAQKELKRLQPNYPINIENANDDDVDCYFEVTNKYFNDDYIAQIYNNKLIISCDIITASKLIYRWRFFINPIQNQYVYLASYSIYDCNSDTMIEYFCRKDNDFEQAMYDAVICPKTKKLSKKQAIKTVPRCVENHIIDVYYNRVCLKKSLGLKKIQ